MTVKTFWQRCKSRLAGYRRVCLRGLKSGRSAIDRTWAMWRTRAGLEWPPSLPEGWHEYVLLCLMGAALVMWRK